MSLPLRFLGEPILDAGLAACLLQVGKSNPTKLTLTDWQAWLDQIQKDYETGVLDTLLGVAFTQNGFNNPSWKGSARSEKIREIFALARGGLVPKGSEPRPEQGTKCFFYSSEDAVLLAGRDRFPLLGGRGVMNFTPNGAGYIPLSPWALGCVLGFMYVAPFISGRFLVVSSPAAPFLLDLCKQLQGEYILKWLTFMRQGKKLEVKAPLTRLGETLDKVFENTSAEEGSDEGVAPVVVWHFSNSGQDPWVDVYRYPLTVQAFLRRMHAQRYRRAWQAFVHTFWEGTGRKAQDQNELTNKNKVYEFLPRLAEEPHYFLRVFFQKGYAYRRVKEKNAYEPIWELVEVFCLYFLPTMTQEKIETLRRLAKTLADMVTEGIEPKADRELLGLGGARIHQYGHWRALLIRLLRRYLQAKNALLFTLDEYLQLFEVVEGLPEADWRLARDLLQIALLEELYKRKYFEKNPDILEAIAKLESEKDVEIV